MAITAAVVTLAAAVAMVATEAVEAVEVAVVVAAAVVMTFTIDDKISIKCGRHCSPSLNFLRFWEINMRNSRWRLSFACEWSNALIDPLSIGPDSILWGSREGRRLGEA